MVKLVFSSFVIALTPVAVGLAWKGISALGDWFGLRRLASIRGCRSVEVDPYCKFQKDKGLHHDSRQDRVLGNRTISDIEPPDNFVARLLPLDS